MVTRYVLVAALAALLQAAPAYDVSTIRVSPLSAGHNNVDIDEAHFEATGVDPRTLLQMAFDEPKEMIFGLPAWAEKARYDIRAKSTEADAETLKKLTDDQIRGMLQGLLAERFGLKTHVEDREAPVLELVEVRPSSALTKVDAVKDELHMKNRHLMAKGITMERLAKLLTGEMQRPVIDKTGLTGAYDVDLRWRQDNDAAAAAARDDPAAPPILVTALQEQLGLKLRGGKAKVPVLVVDRFMEPAAN